MNLQNMLKKLPDIQSEDYVKVDGEYQWVPIQIKPEAWVNDGQLHVSGESGDGLVDYYGHEFNDYDSYIHPDLEAWAEKHGCFWEWNDPGSICLAEA